MKQRACNAIGGRFVAEGRLVAFDGAPPSAINVRPWSPDQFADFVAFGSGEDPHEDPAAFGTWVLRKGDQPQRIADWRSPYPGKFHPQTGDYYFGAKQDRSHYYVYRGAAGLSGPFPAPSANIEGIAYFLTNGAATVPIGYSRSAPVFFPPYTLQFYTLTGGWVFGLQAGTTRSLARNPAGEWFLVTDVKFQYFPCVAAQTDGSLLVAWNSDKLTFSSSHDGWTPLHDSPTPPHPPLPPLPAPPNRFHPTALCAFDSGEPQSRIVMAGTVGWWSPVYDQRYVYEAVADAPAYPRLWGVPLGTEGSGDPDPQPTIECCRARNVGGIAQSDARIWLPEAERIYAAFVAGGVRAYAGLQAYGYADETPEQSEARVESLVKDMKKLGRDVVLVSTAQAPYSRPLAPLLDKLINLKYPATIRGHVVFRARGLGSDPSTVHYWADRWATMPPGMVAPL